VSFLAGDFLALVVIFVTERPIPSFLPGANVRADGEAIGVFFSTGAGCGLKIVGFSGHTTHLAGCCALQFEHIHGSVSGASAAPFFISGQVSLFDQKACVLRMGLYTFAW
jgi:hypothetical protein